MGQRIYRMTELLETFVFLALLFAGFVHSRERRAAIKTDPCRDYIVLNDIFLDVSYTDVTNNFSSVMYMTWYRYLNYGQGSLAMTCPDGTQCGTMSPIWVNDTLPDYGDNATAVDVCYKNATDCCSSKGNVRVKNCKTFLVFFLGLQSPPVRYCFDKSLTPLGIEEVAGSNIGLIAGAAGGGVVAVSGLLLLIIFLVRQMQKKANAVDTSKPDANSAENAKSQEKTANGTT